MSASDEIAGLTAGELTAYYKAGALTPLEATLAIFARIERLNPLYNAFALIDVKTPPIVAPPLNCNRGKFSGRRGSQSLQSVIQAMNDFAAA